MTHNQNGQMSCWHGKNNKPYIKFDYTTCDVNASCNANNMCVCNSGYMGSGASCTGITPLSFGPSLTRRIH